MEFRKFLSFLMVLLCCSLVMIGCSDDDDDSSNDQTTEVVDEGEQTPGNDDATFDDFGSIITSGGRVAFIADSNSSLNPDDEFEGIYTDISADSLAAAAGSRASLRQVASTRDDEDAPEGSPTDLPGNAGNVTEFKDVALDRGNVYFSAASVDELRATGEQGIYVDNGGDLDKVVDFEDSPEGANGNEFFGDFDQIAVEDGTIAFTATVEDNSGARTTGAGIFYTNDNGETISVLADNETLAPNISNGNGNELFEFDGEGLGAVDGLDVDEDGNIAFIAEYEEPELPFASNRPVEAEEGVFIGTDEESLVNIADSGTEIPGNTDNTFNDFDAVSVSDGKVAFIGGEQENFKRDNGVIRGVYSDVSDSLEAIADTSTEIPEEPNDNVFCEFDHVVIDGTRIVFSGYDDAFNDVIERSRAAKAKGEEFVIRDLDGTSGIYVFHSGDTLEKVIDNRDLIPGSSDQTFRFAVALDFEDDEINASIATSAQGSSFDADEADTVLTVEDTPSIVSFRTKKNRANTVLNWKTVCGEVLGFHVWRSSGEEYERITSSAIAPDRSATREAVEFSYTDTSLEAGQYFYKLEIMKLDGTSEMIRPAYND